MHGCVDHRLINYAKLKNLSFLNLGLVPMSGISQPDNTAEMVVKYAFEKIRGFAITRDCVSLKKVCIVVGQ